MKIVHLTDLHLSWEKPVSRLDNVIETQFEKFDYVLNWAGEHEAIVIITGDIFDKPRSWYLLPRVIRILRKYSNVKVFAVFGQHDTYLYSATTRDATSLGILAKAGLVTILGKYKDTYFDCGESGFWHLFGANYGDKVPDPIEGDFNILAIHAPIAEKALFPNHEYFDAYDFLIDHKFDLILCGDIHRRFNIKNLGFRYILNSGPMLRRTADQYNMSFEPGFFEIDICDDMIINLHKIPHRPAKDVLTREHLEKAQHNVDMLNDFISSLVDRDMDDEGSADLVANIWKFVEENGIEQEVVDLLSQIMGEKDG